MTWRQWFVVSTLLFINVLIFGCMFLFAMQRIRFGF